MIKAQNFLAARQVRQRFVNFLSPAARVRGFVCLLHLRNFSPISASPGGWLVDVCVVPVFLDTVCGSTLEGSERKARRFLPTARPMVTLVRPRASQPVEAARVARERELHLVRLANIERGAQRQRSNTGRAGAGPDRPWAQKPPTMPGGGRNRQPPCATGAPRTGTAPRPRSAPVLSRPADHVHREHQRNVASLFNKLTKVQQGVEWQRQRQQEAALSAGRAQHTTAGARRRQQRSLTTDNVAHMRRLRRTEARFATPAEIALLTGKPMPGADGADGGGGGDDE